MLYLWSWKEQNDFGFFQKKSPVKRPLRSCPWTSPVQYVKVVARILLCSISSSFFFHRQVFTGLLGWILNWATPLSFGRYTQTDFEEHNALRNHSFILYDSANWSFRTCSDEDRCGWTCHTAKNNTLQMLGSRIKQPRLA